ncbi:MAG TPA: FGGY family carbohydrate kinase [Pseudonocardia sp.]|nr:FGGY family carbohydrate kinase [Pseudonocardia sp.]
MPWLGVDVGTSSTKAVVYSDAGRPVGSGRAATPWYTGPHGVEVDPMALRESAFAAIAEALRASGEPVGGVGIASMGETGVLVDGHGAPLAPAIAWHDGRDGAEAERLVRDVDPASFTRRTGKPPTNQYALTKHRWLTAHVPASRAAVRRFNVAEWVARGLGADEVSERSLASRTGWLDLASAAFDPELLAWSGAAASLMPPLVAAGQPIGTATHPPLAGAVVTIAGHDHQAAAVGTGVAGAGDLLDSHGSAEAVLRTVTAGLAAEQVEALAAAGITTDLGVQVGNWSLLGGTQGGLVLRHTLDELGVAWADLAELDAAALAADLQAGAAGDRAPADASRMGATASRSATGPAVANGAGGTWRAVIEAETRAAAERIATMARIVGPHQRLVVTGGWCASAAVLAAKRRLFGPLVVADVAEAGTFGAATLAARAAGALGPADTLA